MLRALCIGAALCAMMLMYIAPAAAGLSARDLAVIVNVQDPLSLRIGEYYSRRRHVPASNLVRLSFDPRRAEITPPEFLALRAEVNRRLSANIQAYALTWTRPYRVGCMSITAAFTLGFDARNCVTGCDLTLLSPYYDSQASRPFDELNLRPSMNISALDWVHAKALIDRGVLADGSAPKAAAYLLSGTDAQRGVRSAEYDAARRTAAEKISVELLRASSLRDRRDVMFYFIGASDVAGLEDNHFLPGAVADHLTSFGGMLTDSPQMSSLRWLEAGATGSYGTVVEPCNFLEKFPNIEVLMRHYLAGETLIEAYWKSVAMPAQGLFIGEPLAAPYRERASRAD